MTNKKKLANTLIKKKVLYKFMKNEKISRIEKGVFALIENKISEELNLLIKKFKENSEISGSRVLTTEIVKKTFEELNEEEEIEY